MTLHASLPTRRRKLLAAGVYIFFGVIASLIRLSRADFDLFPTFASLDFNGTSPNFFVCLAGPFIAFLGNDIVDIVYYLKMALGMAIGLSIYEGIQIYLPSRTFDFNDIWASILGASCSFLIVTVLFLLLGKKATYIEPSSRANSHPPSR